MESREHKERRTGSKKRMRKERKYLGIEICIYTLKLGNEKEKWEERSCVKVCKNSGKGSTSKEATFRYFRKYCFFSILHLRLNGVFYFFNASLFLAFGWRGSLITFIFTGCRDSSGSGEPDRGNDPGRVNGKLSVLLGISHQFNIFPECYILSKNNIKNYAR